jgi:hypothetical protein
MSLNCLLKNSQDRGLVNLSQEVGLFQQQTSLKLLSFGYKDDYRRAKRWKGGDMLQRWAVAALRAEKRFKRVKGYREIPKLIAA